MNNNCEKKYMELVDYIEYMKNSIDLMRLVFDKGDTDSSDSNSIYAKRVMELFEGLAELIAEDRSD